MQGDGLPKVNNSKPSITDDLNNDRMILSTLLIIITINSNKQNTCHYVNFWKRQKAEISRNGK